MMHDGGWFAMGGAGLYWQIPILMVVVVTVVWLVTRRRARDGS
jgi:cytochrome c-type biogenesis protein CcmH/NrfF